MYLNTGTMSSTFAGFSEEELKRIKSEDSRPNSALQINSSNVKKIDKLGAKPKRTINCKLPVLQKQDSDDNIDELFEKCKLSLRSPTSPSDKSNDMAKQENQPETDVINNNKENVSTNAVKKTSVTSLESDTDRSAQTEIERKKSTTSTHIRKTSTDTTPDIVRCVDNYTEDELAAHSKKLEELQLQQKIMEEQNKKRKEMLSKALADRTKQTEEEVLRLEKIKKELQVLDGQFSQDVAVLRKKIDQACLSYADAEKHYLRVEKEFLQAKIQLQKEREKKELLTEHLCALITHNETRKAQKLETLMLELASDKKVDCQVHTDDDNNVNDVTLTDDDEKPVIVDGVDEKTGKIVEFTS